MVFIALPIVHNQPINQIFVKRVSVWGANVFQKTVSIEQVFLKIPRYFGVFKPIFGFFCQKFVNRMRVFQNTDLDRHRKRDVVFCVAKMLDFGFRTRFLTTKIIARNSAPIKMKSPAALKKQRMRNSTECTGLRDVMTNIAEATASSEKR